MSVRTETFGHQAPRHPLVSVVAAVLAFAVGIALGAIVMDRDSAVPSGDSGAAVESRGWDQGMLDAAAQRSAGLNSVGFQPGVAPRGAGVLQPGLTAYRGWDAGMLAAAEQRAGVTSIIGWDAGMLAAAEQRAGAYDVGGVRPWDAGMLSAAAQRAGGSDQGSGGWVPIRNQAP